MGWKNFGNCKMYYLNNDDRIEAQINIAYFVLLNDKEKNEIVLLFSQVAKEFIKEVNRLEKLWDNGHMIPFIMMKKIDIINNFLFPAINNLYKKSDAMITGIIYGIFDYYNCLDFLNRTNNPFAYKVGKIYHEASSRLNNMRLAAIKIQSFYRKRTILR